MTGNGATLSSTGSHLRLLAPVLVDFHLVPGAAARRDGTYADFWAGAESMARTWQEEQQTPSSAKFTFPHSANRNSVHLYQDIGDHSEGTTVHVFSGTVLRRDLTLALPDDVPQTFVPADTVVRFNVFDHGIMLLETAIPLLDHRRLYGTGAEALDQLEAYAVAVGDALAVAVQNQLLGPLVAALRSTQRRGKDDVVAESETELTSADEFGSPLWVTRTLHLDPADPHALPMLQYWLRHVDTTDENNAEALVQGRAASNITFVNYAVMTPEPQGHGTLQHAEWEGLRYAQYYYAALDRIDSLLAQVLAETTASTAPARVKHLRELLVRFTERADMIVMDRHRVSKYLPRGVRASMEAVLSGWDHDHLVAQPVQHKLGVCQRHLDELERRRSAKSSVVTDLILLCIGITSILATALALTDFGRSTALDPHLTGTGGGSLVAWVSAQPADAILISSLVISMAAVAIYFFFRSDTER